MRLRGNAWLVKKCLRENMSNSKEIIFKNPNLVAVQDKQEIVFNTDNQFLYLYPLNIIDYVNSFRNKKPIKLVVKNFKTEDCYKILNFVDNIMSKDEGINRCVELEIKDEVQDWNLVEKILDYLFQNNIEIVLNFKSYIQLKDYIKIFKFVNCFKFSIYDCCEFEKILKEFKNIKKDERQFLFAKIYLKENQINRYHSLVKKLKGLKFDYVLFSKELMPKEGNNIKISPMVKYNLFKIKHKFEDERFKIKIVKDLTTLYYPLFTLDERNTKKCYASKVCNYLINGRLYPCATQQILKDNVLLEDEDSKNYIGSKCSDCASIFENDYLEQILKLDFDQLKFVEPTIPQINPLAIGTFKYVGDYKQIKNSFIMGQNLIDCNLAYNNGKTLRKIARYISSQRKGAILYCKLYKTISKVEDIEMQVDEYLKILKAKSLDIVSIHSLDILKNIELIDVYKELQRLQRVQKIKYLGLCNINKNQLEEVINAGIKILTFEGVYNLYCKYYETCGVFEICSKNDIKFIAYQPLIMGKFDFMKNDALNELSIKYNKTIFQILLNYYILHKNIIVLVKSSNLLHIIENSNYDFYIKDEDYAKLDKLNIDKKFNVSFEGGKNKIYFLSYELLKDND